MAVGTFLPLGLGEKQPKLPFTCTGIWDLLSTISCPAFPNGLRAVGVLSWTQEQGSLGLWSPLPCCFSQAEV